MQLWRLDKVLLHDLVSEFNSINQFKSRNREVIFFTRCCASTIQKIPFPCFAEYFYHKQKINRMASRSSNMFNVLDVWERSRSYSLIFQIRCISEGNCFGFSNEISHDSCLVLEMTALFGPSNLQRNEDVVIMLQIS
jgi:hypothetical protein